MARYEHGGKFWQIARSGAALTVTSGKLANKGRTTVKHLPTEGAAQSHLDQLVLEKQREGYRLVDRADPVAAAAEVVGGDDADALEAAIADAPYDPAAYAVYADWLQRHGDPRGELIALQLAADAETLAKPTAKSPAQIAISKVLAKHATTLFGKLASLVTDVRDPAKPPLIWRFGFIHRAELQSSSEYPLDRVLDDLLRHPSGRFLAELAVRVEQHEASPVLATIDHLLPASLRVLDLFIRNHVSLVELWPALQRVERVTIAARSFELGAIELPAARRLRLLASNMRGSAVRSLATAPWPILERLELRFCGPLSHTDSTFDDLKPLLIRTDLPALTHLKLRGVPFAGAVLREITRSDFAAQLQVLDLSQGNVFPSDIDFLANHKHAFPELRELWLPSSRLATPLFDRLTGIAKHVLGDHRAPIDNLDIDLGTFERATEVTPTDDVASE